MGNDQENVVIDDDDDSQLQNWWYNHDVLGRSIESRRLDHHNIENAPGFIISARNKRWE